MTSLLFQKVVDVENRFIDLVDRDFRFRYNCHVKSLAPGSTFSQRQNRRLAIEHKPPLTLLPSQFFAELELAEVV